MWIVVLIIFTLSVSVLGTIIIRNAIIRLSTHNELDYNRPYFDNWFTINYLSMWQEVLKIYHINIRSGIRKLALSSAKTVHWLAVRMVIGANRLAEKMDKEIAEYSEAQKEDEEKQTDWKDHNHSKYSQKWSSLL
jgi:hypothetical protein